MNTTGAGPHVATLWRLTWGGTSLRCEVYRSDGGFHLSVESPVAAIVRERFDFEPRAVARAHALREALKRRGWVEPPPCVPTSPGAAPSGS